MAKPQPPANAITQTFQVGSYNPLGENANSDGFTLKLDMNDGVTWQLMPTSIRVQRQEQDVRSDNIRVPGEYVVANQYKNMMVSASFSLSRKNDAAGVAQANMVVQLRTLISVLKNPPFTLRYAYPYATQYSYADVVKVHGIDKIPLDPILWNNKTLLRIDLAFECAYGGWRGDRLTLQNLCTNAGAEGPAGGGNAQGTAVGLVTVFNDTFVSTNQYTSIAGGAPTVTANVMTIPSGATIGFGSPAWGPINNWQVRFQWITGLTAAFLPHRTDANNDIDIIVTNGSLSLRQVVAGTAHVLASSAPALTTGNFYWVKITQYPSVSGNAPMLQVSLFNDSSGAIGSAVTSGALGPVATFDAVTALVGKMAMVATGAALAVGGAFSSVHTVSLFGPGGWYVGFNATGALCSPAWDGTRGELGMSGTAVAGTQTYPNGPVTSFGAVRVDICPASTPNVTIENGDRSSAAQVKLTGIPVSAAGNVLGYAVQVISSGLSATATILLAMREFDSTGAFLRSTTVQTLTGNQASWTTISGSYTSGASTAYVIPGVNVQDSTANSANGTVWIDNMQVYNQTTTGQTSMPYCELRFANSPAQLVVSGLLGDMVAPAWLGIGTYFASWASPTTNVFAIGRRPQAPATGGAFFSTFTTGTTPTLDSTAYGGYYMVSTNAFASWLTGTFLLTASEASGIYHLFCRAITTESTSPSTNISVLAWTKQYLLSGTLVSQFLSGKLYPFSAANVWTMIDCGQVSLPPTAQGALNDLTQIQYQVAPNFNDALGASQWKANAMFLLPADGSLLVGTLVNNQGTVTSSWVWAYSDPLPSASSTAPSWTFSTETTALPNAAHAAGGPGASTSGSININPTSDPYLSLDPGIKINGVSVNQLVASMTDQTAATIYAAHYELAYSPYYLSPR